MSEQNTGGPAFPCLDTNWNVDQQKFEMPASQGMTLRDYFASQVIVPPSLAVAWGEEMVGPYPAEIGRERMLWWAAVAAKFRYVEADAMLKAREAA